MKNAKKAQPKGKAQKPKPKMAMSKAGAPIAQANTMSFKPKKEESHREMVDLYLGQVAPTTATSEVIMSRLLYPSCVEPSTWAVMASIYSQYRVHSVEIEYRPDVGTTTDGSLFLWFDPDAESDDPNIDVIPEVAKAHVAKQTAVWNRTSVTVKTPGNWLGTTPTGDFRTYACGVVRVATNSTLTIAKVYGSVYVRACVEFRNRTLNPNLAVSARSMSTFSASSVAVVNGGSYDLGQWFSDAAVVEPTKSELPLYGSGVLVKAGSWLLRNFVTASLTGATGTGFLTAFAPLIRSVATEIISGLATSFFFDDELNIGNVGIPREVHDTQLYLNTKEDVWVSFPFDWGGSAGSPSVKQAVMLEPVALSSIDEISLTMAMHGDMRTMMTSPGHYALRRVLDPSSPDFKPLPKRAPVAGVRPAVNRRATASHCEKDFHEIVAPRTQPLHELKKCHSSTLGSESVVTHSQLCRLYYEDCGKRYCDQ